MSTTTRLLLLTLVAMTIIGVFTATTAHAQDDDDEDVVTRGSDVPEDPKVDMTADDDDDDEPEAVPEEEEEEVEEAINGLTAKTVFLGDAVSEQLPAGEWVETVVAFDNVDDSESYFVRFVAAHVNQIGDAQAIVQNFTGNTYERTVKAKATGSFKYRFQPHKNLDPRDYNLVVRVFFTNSNNETSAIAAFNGTVTITEPLGTDPELIMTFATIAALIGAGVWWFKNKATGRKSTYSASTPATKNVEMGTSGQSYDKSYISAEHLKFQEALAKSQSRSPKRSSSNKK